ncbi:MAG: DnaD domain protein [Clostridiales bacterium]|nr:DnaD domain protein [Clostridiales bacterium]
MYFSSSSSGSTSVTRCPTAHVTTQSPPVRQPRPLLWQPSTRAISRPTLGFSAMTTVRPIGENPPDDVYPFPFYAEIRMNKFHYTTFDGLKQAWYNRRETCRKMVRRSACMAMFSFDEQAALFDVTPLPNQFILNYLPEASGDAVRVYLFGLVACYHHEAISDLQQMARELNMTEDDIRAAYRYWERKGLVQRVADNPPQYRYQNIYQVMMTGAQAQIDPAYEQFAEAIYGVFDNDRRLHGKDVSQCYEWVEQMRLPPDVVIAMMRHMVQKHGKNVSMKKAEQMAMRLADEKVQTVEEAQEIFRRDQTVWSGSKKVLEKLGLRRYPTEPEQTMYSKWLVDWQFTPDAILRAVDETIKSSNPSFAYLDGILKRLHEQGNVRTEQDVSGDIEGSRKENEPIKQFLRALGNYSITINDTTKATYKSFQTMYPDPVILLAAQQCAKWGMTTLQDVMQTLMAWQNRSLRTLPEIDAYMRQIDEQNEFLIVLYQAMQLDEKTKPNAADRALVKQWTEEWRFAQMFVLGCAPWAAGKKSPMAYLNKMLKVFRGKGITTMEAAKAERERFEQQPSQSTAPAARAPKVVGEQQYTQRTYTPTQDAMDAMMQEWEESHA